MAMTLAQTLAATVDNGTLALLFLVASGGIPLLVSRLLLRRARHRRPAAYSPGAREPQTEYTPRLRRLAVDGRDRKDREPMD